MSETKTERYVAIHTEYICIPCETPEQGYDKLCNALAAVGADWGTQEYHYYPNGVADDNARSGSTDELFPPDIPAALPVNPKEELLRKVGICPECRSLDIDGQNWVSINTGEVGNDCKDENYCNACERDGGENFFKYYEEVPLNQTREWRELFAAEQAMLAEDPAAALQMEWTSEEMQRLRSMLEPFLVRGKVLE